MLVRTAQLHVVGTQPLFTRLLEDTLHTRLPDFPNFTLIIDGPVGFAFQAVTPERAHTSIVLTQNTCPEYLDDLWHLGLLGLVVQWDTVEQLASLLRRMETHQRVRVTPPAPSALTGAERGLLRLVARGLSNKEIARELGIANQTVQNGLTRVFQKLAVDGRIGALQYYWGLNASAAISADHGAAACRNATLPFRD